MWARRGTASATKIGISTDYARVGRTKELNWHEGPDYGRTARCRCGVHQVGTKPRERVRDDVCGVHRSAERRDERDALALPRPRAEKHNCRALSYTSEGGKGSARRALRRCRERRGRTSSVMVASSSADIVTVINRSRAGVVSRVQSLTGECPDDASQANVRNEVNRGPDRISQFSMTPSFMRHSF